MFYDDTFRSFSSKTNGYFTWIKQRQESFRYIISYTYIFLTLSQYKFIFIPFCRYTCHSNTMHTLNYLFKKKLFKNRFFILLLFITYENTSSLEYFLDTETF